MLPDQRPTDLDFSHGLDRLPDTVRIGYARVSKADGSQSLDLPCDALQAAATRDLSSPSGFPPVRQCPSIWRETACGRLRTLPY